MKKEILDALDSFPNVMKTLESIPRQLWDIFLPDTIEDLAMLEADIVAQRDRDRDRDKVMAIQQLCGFPLRPNESVQDVTARARIQGLKNQALLDDYRKNNPGLKD